jgi:hypothetical protein
LFPDHVLVDVVVQDHGARALWKKYFWGRSSVSWDDFLKAVCTTLQVEASADQELDILCLKVMTFDSCMSFCF